MAPERLIGGWQDPRRSSVGVQERGLCHSLRCRALHADEASPHKAHLARGHVPAHTPGQARHLGADDLDDITDTEGYLFGP